MKIKYARFIKKLWNLAGEIGTIAETNKRYSKVYQKLAEALDEAELSNLIKYKEIK